MAEPIQQNHDTPQSGMTQPDRMVWRSDMRRAMRCSSETIRRYMREGRLPALDVDITSKMQGWRLSTLHAAGVRIAVEFDD